MKLSRLFAVLLLSLIVRTSPARPAPAAAEPAPAPAPTESQPGARSGEPTADKAEPAPAAADSAPVPAEPATAESAPSAPTPETSEGAPDSERDATAPALSPEVPRGPADAGEKAGHETGAMTHAGDAAHAVGGSHAEQGLVPPPPGLIWPGVLTIVILGLFLAAAVIGPIVRNNLPEEVPPAHSHDEPPGASHHHGRSGTLNREPDHGHASDHGHGHH